MNDNISKYIWEIDPNLLSEKKEPMRQGRYNTPLALVQDRFIFALGGMIGKNNSTQQVEVYDVNTNNWYPAPDMPKARSYTSACVMNEN